MTSPIQSPPLESSDGIAWDQVSDRLPSTTHELLEEIRSVYIENPDESARAIEVALRARLAKLELRFEAAKKGGVS